MYNQKKQMLRHAFTLMLLFWGACSYAGSDISPKSLSPLGFKVIQTFPHDASHYTEGLVLHDGDLIESAGQYGESGLYEIELKTGKILRSRKIAPQFFAEGIAIAHGRIVQLTWREQTAFVYDLTFNPIDTLTYGSEGWGLASYNDDKEMVMSDGTSTLRFIDSDDYHFLRQITVHDGDKKIVRLNELESANGYIYANVWLTDMIAVIDPADGHVAGWLDLSRLKTLFNKPPKWDPGDDVLNGIAYDPHSGHFYITGKRWPALFEIAIDPPPRAPKSVTP